MKKTMSAITAAAAVTSCFTGFGAASFSAPAKAATQTNTLPENTNQSAAELVKNLYNTAYKGEMPQQAQGLTINKSTKGDVHAAFGDRKDQSGETIDLIYITGIWDKRATDFPIIKT